MEVFMAEEKINSEIDVQDSDVEKNVANTESIEDVENTINNAKQNESSNEVRLEIKRKRFTKSEPAEPLGKNQCLGWQAVRPFFPGLHRIPATTRASSCLQATEKMLLSEARVQPVPAGTTEPAALTQGSPGLTSWARG